MKIRKKQKKYRLLTKPFVEHYVRKHLSKKKFGDGKKDLENKSLREHGVDIKVKHRNFGQYFLVEVKGNPSPSVKYPHGSRNSSMNSALGQIITRMHTKRRKRSYKWGYKYGVAFPYSFKNVLKKIPYDVCYKLNLYVFLVYLSGKVEEYNHKKLKKIQA
ncbi:MAG: hypothetical protein UV08_C0010G0008 [Parcubacteria group bacterium GW2011_GWA2_42_18]|nr:MAG: hypothetical protein UV08_C0010G0008 [Parcubacteria group bacterium GW2011_GWA2_42_18]